jgi:hypothetical protein
MQKVCLYHTVKNEPEMDDPNSRTACYAFKEYATEGNEQL